MYHFHPDHHLHHHLARVLLHEAGWVRPAAAGARKAQGCREKKETHSFAARVDAEQN